MITMTAREALAIQAKQVKHYGHLRADLAAVVAEHTDVAGIDLDTPMSIIDINKRIPRGSQIEWMCGIDGGGS